MNASYVPGDVADQLIVRYRLSRIYRQIRIFVLSSAKSRSRARETRESAGLARNFNRSWLTSARDIGDERSERRKMAQRVSTELLSGIFRISLRRVGSGDDASRWRLVDESQRVCRKIQTRILGEGSSCSKLLALSSQECEGPEGIE